MMYLVFQVLTLEKRKHWEEDLFSRRNLHSILMNFLLATCLCPKIASLRTGFLSLPPDAKDDLQQGANAGDEEDGADEVALREAVVLQAQALRQDQRDGNDPSKGRQTVLTHNDRKHIHDL